MGGGADETFWYRLVVEDDKYNYLSGRWPGDAEPLAERIVEVVEAATGTS